MPFHFSFLCHLLSGLEKIATHEPSLTPKAVASKTEAEIYAWFRQHRHEVDEATTDGVAFLSALLPEKRSDRVYQLQPLSLTRILGRCFGLGSSRILLLQRWERPGCGDLGLCVERVLHETPFPTNQLHDVMIEEIDAVLARIASRCRFSGPSVRGKQTGTTCVDVERELASIYHRLTPCESKWFTRLLLKNYSPVTLPERSILRHFHHLLPGVMKIHDSFESAVALLHGPDFNWASPKPSPAEAMRQQNRAANHLVPSCGVKIGRPFFLKAWSVKHTVQLARGRRMGLERKHDGEYCQVHVDLSRPGNEIQIFSKSGKDSTVDRRGIHDTIKECLRLGQADCRFDDKCILEGEIVVWSDQEQRILEFHKLRKHLERSGTFIGTARDSQQHPWEHLMIVFFDVMLVDESPILHQNYENRRKILRDLIKVIPGRAGMVTSQTFDFSSRRASQQLVEALATAFAHRWEGYVLKPIDEPYIDLHSQPSNDYRSCWIKMKKDKIPGLGDTADFAVIGARYDAQEALKLGVPGLPWTTFYIGCLQNKADFLRGAKPSFRVLDGFEIGINKHELKTLCEYSKFSAENVRPCGVPDSFSFSIEGILPRKLAILFTQPLVVEVKGTGFDKPPNTGYLILRFPRVIKIHLDRSIKEIVGFDDLQAMAEEAMNAPEGDFDTDVAMWTERLIDSERGARGEPCQWEDTPERESALRVNTITLASSQISPKNTSRPRLPTFVRMDTAEMLPTERDLAIGIVPPHSSSPRSASGMSSSGTLPSSPSSSPVVAREHAEKIGLRPAEKLGKRLWEDSTETPPVFKRPRTAGDSGAVDRRLWNSNILSPPSPRTALSSISHNAAPRAEVLSDAADLSGHRSTAPGLNFVKKIPALSIKGPVKKSRSRAATQISSPPQETTASEYRSTTAASSFSEQPHPQSIAAPLAPDANPTSHDTPGVPSAINYKLPPHNPITSSPISTSTSPSPRKVPSPHNLPTHTPPPPPFPTVLTTLSPCLTHMPYLTETLLPSQNAHTVLPEHLLLLCPRANRPDADPILVGQKIILLVESYRDVPTAAFLKRMLPLTRAGCEVEAWDWRVLEAVSEAGRGRKWFLGWLRLIGGREGVVWKGGEMSVGKGGETSVGKREGGAERVGDNFRASMRSEKRPGGEG